MNNPNTIDPKYFEREKEVHAMTIEKLVALVEMIDSDDASTSYTLSDGKSFSAYELEKELAIIGALYLCSNVDMTMSEAVKTQTMLKEAFDHEFNS